MRDAGTKVLEQCSSLLPQSVARPRHVLETGEPAKIVLDAANSTKADVIALGTRNRNRLTEVALGSVSHRVVLHAPCATFLVKRPVPDQPRVLLAVEQYDDARSMVEWLTSHPFSRPITVTVFSVAATPQLADPLSLPVFLNWEAEARAAARKLVDDIAQQLKDAGHPATVKVASGDPGRAIHQESTQHDLLIVGSHGRKGLERFLLGSVSHAAVHGSACSVLILRTP
jgi:nucleotide-binding universal stress UspA family protein